MNDKDVTQSQILKWISTDLNAEFINIYVCVCVCVYYAD